MEGRIVRPRQVRYQAALRPDSIASLILNHFHERHDPVRVYELFRFLHTLTPTQGPRSFLLRRSEAAHEKISCAREHFLSHRGVW